MGNRPFNAWKSLIRPIPVICQPSNRQKHLLNSWVSSPVSGRILCSHNKSGMRELWVFDGGGWVFLWGDGYLLELCMLHDLKQRENYVQSSGD